MKLGRIVFLCGCIVVATIGIDMICQGDWFFGLGGVVLGIGNGATV